MDQGCTASHSMEFSRDHYDSRPQGREPSLEGSLVKHTCQEREPAESEVARRRTVMLNLRAEAAALQLLPDGFGVVEAIERGKHLLFRAARAEAPNVEFVEPVRGGAGDHAGVIVAARSMKQEQSFGFKDPGNFAVACERRLEVLRYVVMKDKIERLVRKGQGLGAALVAFIEEWVVKHARIGINSHIASNSSAQGEMILMIATGSSPDFQHVIGRPNVLQHQISETVGRIVGIVFGKQGTYGGSPIFVDYGLFGH